MMLEAADNTHFEKIKTFLRGNYAKGINSYLSTTDALVALMDVNGKSIPERLFLYIKKTEEEMAMEQTKDDTTSKKWDKGKQIGKKKPPDPCLHCEGNQQIS